jgi:hypothetical protein
VERSTWRKGEALNQPWGNTPNHPSAAPPMLPAPAKRSNTIGLIALIISVIGFVFACIIGTMTVD